MLRWFGRRYAAEVYDDCPQVPTPAGVACGHCGELIEPNADGFVLPLVTLREDGASVAGDMALHRNCHLRTVVGSVAHQQRRCSCYVPGVVDEDPPGMTPREAADAAVAYYEKRFETLQ